MIRTLLQTLLLVLFSFLFLSCQSEKSTKKSDAGSGSQVENDSDSAQISDSEKNEPDSGGGEIKDDFVSGDKDGGSELTDDANLQKDDANVQKDDEEVAPADADNIQIETRDCSNECGKGKETLIDGVWQNCTAPQKDEEDSCYNYNDFGSCTGVKICNPAVGWGECDAKVPGEEIFDEIDNDCNGKIDDGLINPVTDGTVDEGLDVISGDDPDNPTGKPGISLAKDSKILPYLWAANHDNDTVSKFNTETHIEEARYWVGDDPSRTAVDLDGNMWVGTRKDGRVTQVLWDTTSCKERNGDAGIQTSYIDDTGKVVVVNNGATPEYDECISYHAKPVAEMKEIRGMAVAPDGKIWVGYTEGGILSIDPKTKSVGNLYKIDKVPLWKPDLNDGNIYKNTGELSNVGGVYGLIIDANGLLWISSTTRKNLGCFDTKTETWVGNFQKDGACSYGIAVDDKDRVWLGGYPDCKGVAMFDNKNKKMYSFLVPSNAEISPKSISPVEFKERGASGGKSGWDTTGIVVEPRSNHVWTSFYNKGYTGRLMLDETDLSKSSWVFIATVKDKENPANNIPDAGNDLRGVGFDALGYAWTLGKGSDKVFKLDPATNERAADLPLGKSIGVGSHYTYSDFTGSTAFNFTAPRGIWRHIFVPPYDCVRPIRIDWEAFVPENTTAGLRIRALKKDETPLDTWLPDIDLNGDEYVDYPLNASENEILIEDYTEAFIGEKYEVEVLMTSKNRSVRPILHAVNIIWEYDREYCSDNIGESFFFDLF